MDNNKEFEYMDDEYIEISDGDITKSLLLLDTFGIDEQDYAALFDEEVEQLYIFEVDIDEEDAIFTPIEDQDELKEILELYEELLDEEDQEED